jgi:hypothetical protein
MIKIELVPDLSHCIETVAKREHAEVLKQLLTPEGGNKELQEKLEILRLFLQTVDFKKLRVESEQYLLTGKKVKFVIYAEGGAPKYAMQMLSNLQD